MSFSNVMLNKGSYGGKNLQYESVYIEFKTGKTNLIS